MRAIASILLASILATTLACGLYIGPEGLATAMGQSQVTKATGGEECEGCQVTVAGGSLSEGFVDGVVRTISTAIQIVMGYVLPGRSQPAAVVAPSCPLQDQDAQP